MMSNYADSILSILYTATFPLSVPYIFSGHALSKIPVILTCTVDPLRVLST